jgi:phi13 family phage major tail protein
MPRPRIGASDLVYAILDADTDVIGGTPTYGTPVALANLAKIVVNPNGSGVVGFSDDKPSTAAETIGKIDLDFELADISQANYAALLGHGYANGAIDEKADDQSPFVAIGFKALRAGKYSGSKVYDYFWLYKGIFLKPQDTYETKKDSITLQNVTLKGLFVALDSNKSWRFRLRTDDAAAAGLLSSFFTQVTLPTADVTALSVALAQGTTTHAGDLKLTFSKGSGASFGISALNAANVFIINITDDDEVLLPGTFVIGANGTTVVCYFTPTTAITASDNIVAMVTAGVRDSSGVACTPTCKEIAWT